MPFLQILLTIAEVLGALSAIGLALIRIRKWTQPIVVLGQALAFVVRGSDAVLVNGIEITPAVPGLVQQIFEIHRELVALSLRLGKVEAQLAPDHGLSMHDKITTIVEAVSNGIGTG